MQGRVIIECKINSSNECNDFIDEYSRALENSGLSVCSEIEFGLTDDALIVKNFDNIYKVLAVTHLLQQIEEKKQNLEIIDLSKCDFNPSNYISKEYSYERIKNIFNDLFKAIGGIETCKSLWLEKIQYKNDAYMLELLENIKDSNIENVFLCENKRSFMSKATAFFIKSLPKINWINLNSFDIDDNFINGVASSLSYCKSSELTILMQHTETSITYKGIDEIVHHIKNLNCKIKKLHLEFDHTNDMDEKTIQQKINDAISERENSKNILHESVKRKRDEEYPQHTIPEKKQRVDLDQSSTSSESEISTSSASSTCSCSSTSLDNTQTTSSSYARKEKPRSVVFPVDNINSISPTRHTSPCDRD